MEMKSAVDLQLEPSEGGLKELVLRWFTGTQAPLILHNGNFPDWFQGFTARKDAEDLLRDKPLGCFLIRLSDKAIGYILSYKGLDRCRHFVITQNPNGLFVISGDCQTHDSLTELIEHYRASPIQPFGEYLTSSCYEVNTGELYDVVSCNNKGKSGLSVQALCSLWDQKTDGHSDQRIQQLADAATLRPPALPPKATNRKLTGTVSADTMSIAQAVPPVPKRGIPLGLSLSGTLLDRTSHISEILPDGNRAEIIRGNTKPAWMSDRILPSTSDTSVPADPGPVGPPGVCHSQLTPVESRSKSLPRLNNLEEEEEEYLKQLSSHSFTSSTSSSPSPVKRVTCQTYSLHEPRHMLRLSSSRTEQQRAELDMSRSNPLYQTSERPLQGNIMYAELDQRPESASVPDDTYEQIPGEGAAVQGNTYESLDDMKTKKSKSTWGKNNVKWKKFLPDYKKK